MANYAKQFLEELKAMVETYLRTLTSDQDLIEKLMTPFKHSGEPKPEDVDQVLGEHDELLQTQMLQVLSNKDTPHDTRLTQVKLFDEASFNLPSLMKKEKSDFLENQFNALKQRALDVGVEKSEIERLKQSITDSRNDFGVFQSKMDILEGIITQQELRNMGITEESLPILSVPAVPVAKAADQTVGSTLDAKATTAKEKLLALISNGALNDASQNKKLYELAAKLDSGVSNLSAEEAKQLTVAIVQVKNALGDLSESNQEIIQAVSALAQLQLAMSKRYLQAESALIESKNPEGNIKTRQDFIEFMQKAGDAGKVKFDKMDGNVARFAEESKDVRYEIKVKADPENPNNFVITGTDIQKVADLARGIHAVNKTIPLTLKMGNDPEKAFELLRLLTKVKDKGDEVKINITPEQRATFEKTFAKDAEKLASLKSILATQDRLAAQAPEPEAPRALRGP